MASRIHRALGLLAIACITHVTAHGWIRKIQYGNETTDVDPFRKDTLAWYVSYDNDDDAFITGDRYQTPDIICHNKAEPSPLHLTVEAGENVTVYWNDPQAGWGHAGPVMNYMARCDGPCEAANKETLQWFKISQAGVLLDSNPNYPGHDFPSNRYWASEMLDDLNNENGSPWTITIPTDLQAGNYVLRNELIGVHFAVNLNSAQHFPNCFNLEVTGGGSLNPDGIPATEFYHSDDPGLHFDFLTQDTFGVDNYSYPGPPLFNGAVGSSLIINRIPGISRLPQWQPQAGS